MTTVPTTGAPAGKSPSTGPVAALPQVRQRISASGGFRDTPGKLSLILAVILALIAVSGIAGVADQSSRSTTIEDASGQRGRMAIAAFSMYRALSDADAAVTATFLPGLSTHEGFADEYDEGISRASTAVATLSAEAGSQDQSDIVAELAATLPVYTGLVETARTYYRQGLPLGLAYLRDASTLVQEQMLPQLNDLQSSSMENLSGAHDDATEFPWLAVAAVIAALAALGYGQVHVSRRTNRFINVGMAAATLAVVVMAGWMLVAWSGATGHMNTANDNGSQPLSSLSRAHIGAQQARSDEALTLVAQGANTDYEAEYTGIMTELIGEDGKSGILGDVRTEFDDPELSGYVDTAVTAAQDWRSAHQQLREADDNGDYAAAVDSVTSKETGSAGATFQALDDALTKANDLASQRFTSETDQAGSALTALGWGTAVLTVIGMITAALGMQRRISEYR